MGKELVKKQDQELAALTQQSWDSEDDVIEAKDIRIPRALLMQAMSELVGQRKAVAGDIVDSNTFEKLGDEQTPLIVVPITTFKTWTLESLKNGKFEWETSEAYTLQNSTRKKEGFKFVCRDGQEREGKAIEVINLLCFLEKDLGKASALPYVIAFRMTSFQCGQQILTERNSARSENLPFSAYKLKLSPLYTKNDKGQFYKFAMTGKSKNEKFVENAAVLKKWHETFSAGALKVAEESVESTGSASKTERPVSEEY
jgi:hypothetical protein